MGEMQDNFMDYLENEADADIDKRGIIIEQKVEEEINKKYEVIEAISIVDNAENEDGDDEIDEDDEETKKKNKKKRKRRINLINFEENEYDKDGMRKFYKTRNRTNKINKFKKIKKYKLLSDDENNENVSNILVYGIEESQILFPQQNICILWKFMNENHKNLTLEFEINLMHKQYLNVIPKGKKKRKLSIYWDKI